MSDTERELLDEVFDGSQIMARLAGDEETFRAVVDAFRAQDGESMHKLLKHHGLDDRCEIVCRWLRSKECVLLCLELAGEPSPDAGQGPDVRKLAEIVAKLTSDREMVQLMVDAVEDRDTQAWTELVERNGLQEFSHLLCHWVCTVHYRLVCAVVCEPVQVKRPRLGPELRAAGEALGALTAAGEVFEAAVKCVHANDCKSLASTLEHGGFGSSSFLICEFFCSWRCMLVWWRLCRTFPMPAIDSQIAEMLAFARAGGRLAEDRATLERMVGAALREDDELLRKLAQKGKYLPYCIQFCHWICCLRCHLFCICVSPPRTIGVFTKIGGYYYDTDVRSHVTGSGLTKLDARAFFRMLRLNGGLSIVDGSPEIEYHFQTIATDEFGNPTGAWTNVTSGMIAPTNIGSFVRDLNVPEIIEVWVNTPPVVTVPPVPQRVIITPDANGWIKVPPMFPTLPQGPGWRFVPSGDLIKLDTTTLTSFPHNNETGMTAGQSANPTLRTDVHYGIRMRIRDQTPNGTATDVEAGTCRHIAINNTHYDHIAHHPYWAGGPSGTNELAVASLGITELEAAPCSTLASSMHVRFTAAHSHLGAVSVRMEGPGGPYAFTLSPAAGSDPDNNLYGDAPAQGWTFSDLPPCAYLLWLYVEVLLTDGDNIAGTINDYIAFCKGPKKVRIG